MRSSVSFGVILGGLLVAASYIDIWNDVMVELIAVVPTHYLENVSSWGFWVYTAYYLKMREKFGLTTFTECFEDKHAKRVIVVPVKSGCILLGGLSLEIAKECGITVSSGNSDSDIWPRPPSIPTSNDLDLYLAWGFHALWEQKMPEEGFTCVVVTRDPIDRFVSMYKYGRDASETGLRHHAELMKKMNSTEERLRYTWTYYARKAMESTHEKVMKGINRRECVQIRADDLFKGGESFERTSRKFMAALGVKASAQEKLMPSFLLYDIAGKNHSHQSGKSILPGEEKEVRNLIPTFPDIFSVLKQQQKDLKYI